MSASDKVFAGSIPDMYDAYMVPLIFEEYAAQMAQRVAAARPQTVLETAAGTGALTRALADLLSAQARYAVTDLNEPMLQRAAQRQGDDPRIVWWQTDAMSLPFDDYSFDAVCCQFGAMFFPDRVGAYREARRVLREDGQFHFNVWDDIRHNEFAREVTEVASGLFPSDPPLFLARTPHGYHDIRRIEADLRAAGFSEIRIDTVERRSVAPTPRAAAIAFCQGTPLRSEIEARDAGTVDKVTDLAAQAIARKYGDGPISGKMQAHVVFARP